VKCRLKGGAYAVGKRDVKRKISPTRAAVTVGEASARLGEDKHTFGRTGDFDNLRGSESLTSLLISAAADELACECEARETLTPKVWLELGIESLRFDAPANIVLRPANV